MITYSVVENCIIYYILPDENGNYNRALSENAQGMDKGRITTEGLDKFVLEKFVKMQSDVEGLEEQNKLLAEQIKLLTETKDKGK